MRIAIFSDNFYPEISGISDSIISLATELAKRGHVIHFYVPEYSPEDYKKVEPLRAEPRTDQPNWSGARVSAPEAELKLGKNIEIVRLPSYHFGGSTGQGRLVVPNPWRWLEIRKFKPDVIHSQLFFGVGLEAMRASRKLNVPLVGTNHTAIKEFLRYSPIKSEKIDTWILKYVNWYYGKCVLTTAPSKSVIDEMQRYGFKGKSAVLSNPIDTTLFRPADNKPELKKKYGLSSFSLVYAGRLAPEKKIDVVIKAVALAKKVIPEIELVIAGTGSEETSLKNLAASLNVEESVTFLGFISHTRLAEVYNASEAFVMMSTSETQGLVMMQAMASGLPVVAVNARALPEYVNSKNGILIEPGDHETLAKKIIFLFKNPDIRERLGEGARLYSEKFSAPKIAEEWEKIYEGAIASYTINL